MPFSESTTKNVKRKAHFQCCLCKAIGIEIHHIIPQSEGGPDTISNAAPLCPSCHEIYGANPTKRKFIREARDLWYEICEKRYTSYDSVIAEVKSVLANNATKDDIFTLKSELVQAINSFNTIRETTSINVPRNISSKDSTRLLDIRDFLILVIGTPSDREIGQVELLCMREFWPIKQGYRQVYNEFLSKFGKRALRCLASRELDEIKVDVNQQGLTESEIHEALSLMVTEAACMNLLDDGLLVAKLNDNNEVVWCKSQEEVNS